MEKGKPRGLDGESRGWETWYRAAMNTSRGTTAVLDNRAVPGRAIASSSNGATCVLRGTRELLNERRQFSPHCMKVVTDISEFSQKTRRDEVGGKDIKDWCCPLQQQDNPGDEALYIASQ